MYRIIISTGAAQLFLSPVGDSGGACLGTSMWNQQVSAVCVLGGGRVMLLHWSLGASSTWQILS